MCSAYRPHAALNFRLEGSENASLGILLHNLMAEGRSEWRLMFVLDWGRSLLGCSLKGQSFVLIVLEAKVHVTVYIRRC